MQNSAKCTVAQHFSNQYAQICCYLILIVEHLKLLHYHSHIGFFSCKVPDIHVLLPFCYIQYTLGLVHSPKTPWSVGEGASGRATEKASLLQDRQTCNGCRVCRVWIGQCAGRKAEFIKTNLSRPAVATDLATHLPHLLIHFYSVRSAALTAHHWWQEFIKVWHSVSLSFLLSLLIYGKLHFGRY